MAEETKAKYLISIAIGPVQGFIASARRSRDLWFGSWLLSELSKVVAKKIGKESLIFPSVSSDKQLEENSEFNVANKILAIVPEIEENFDQNLRKAITDRLEGIYKPIFEEIEKRLRRDNKYFHRTNAENQIRDMYELYWAAVPYDESNHKLCRKRVEILLSARKATRDFNKPSWGKSVPKSSLDGQRESVIDDTKINDVRFQRIFNLRDNERLCGVGVLKRLAEKNAGIGFASTSHMASLPLLATLKNSERNIEAVEDYIRELTNLIFQIDDKDLGKVPDHLEHPVFKKYDGHLLYEGRLKDLPFEEGDLEKAKEKLQSFLSKVFGRERNKPLPYYVLLQADGDRMGTVIDNQTSLDDHKKLSEDLSKFVSEAANIVNAHQGCLIYAGGDDVLALLPLHTALDCAKNLSSEFAAKLSANSKFVDENRKPPTLSIGLAIYHHTEPLQDALATMRRAEKEAKSVKGKNALAIILSKRSGVDTTIRGRWENDRGTGNSFCERLEWFIQLHRDEALPDGVAYELRDLWLRFKDVEPLRKPMLAEAIRIMKRKYANQGMTPISKKVLDKIEKLIGNQETSIRDLQDKLSLEDLINEIVVARDFAKAYKQANKPAVEGATK